MISEPHSDVRRLLERMVARVGDEPLVADQPTPALLRSVDVLLVETASPDGVRLAQLAHAANPSLAIVCASVAPPPGELGIDFAAVLSKPFTCNQFERALEPAPAA